MSLNDLSDEELAVKAQKNDSAAFDVLFARYKYVAAAGAHSYFLNGGDSEDLLQEGMIAVFKAITTFNGKYNFKSYVYTCVKNRMITVIKSSNRYKNLPLNNYLSLSGYSNGNDKTEIIIDRNFGPEDAFINEESERELKRIIKDVLSSYEYDILALYLQGYSYADIGIKMQKKSKSIDNALQRIRKKLLMAIERVS